MFRWKMRWFWVAAMWLLLWAALLGAFYAGKSCESLRLCETSAR